jgi:hypothetical protein
VSYDKVFKGTASGKPIPNCRQIQQMQIMADGGSVRGQKNIQVKKKPFRGIF